MSGSRMPGGTRHVIARIIVSLFLGVGELPTLGLLLMHVITCVQHVKICRVISALPRSLARSQA
jgi:hypothetical protein